MQFFNAGEPIREEAIAVIESELSLAFPDPVRRCYLQFNGGEPARYVFTNETLDTVLSEFLPLSSKSSGAIASYHRLVLQLKLVPRTLFPFAVDGGGDYFFVDCSDVAGRVYFYRGDTAQAERLIDLKLGFLDFWNSLRME